MTDLLKGYRALDLAEGGAMFCARILGDLGADVIKIEPPGGSRSRNLGPFYRDELHPERSLHWFSYNYNKRGVTLDIRTHDGQEILKDLVSSAHFVIESFAPGHMASLGLGYGDLSQMNPGLVMVSISAFGQDGPHANFKASDLATMAMGGLMYTMGDPDRPPVRFSSPQAELNAGAEGAVGALLAHYRREATGDGQHVDVSAQQCIIWTIGSAAQKWEFYQHNVSRTGSMRVSARTGVAVQQQWPCKDGYVTFDLRLSALTGAGMTPLFDWMAEEELLEPGIRELSSQRDEIDLDAMGQDQVDKLSEAVGRFFLAHTKQDLFEGATARGVMLYPVNTMADVAHDQQLAARGFFVDVEHPELGTAVSYPGPFARLVPEAIQIRRRAPLIGEHNREIYGDELGLSLEAMAALKQSEII